MEVVGFPPGVQSFSLCPNFFILKSLFDIRYSPEPPDLVSRCPPQVQMYSPGPAQRRREILISTMKLATQLLQKANFSRNGSCARQSAIETADAKNAKAWRVKVLLLHARESSPV